MPYYVCPKCGSKDSYEATEIVSEYQKGGSTTITGPENDMGFQPSFTAHQDGETTHRELTVRKCRQCDCLLGSKDLRHTEEEIRLLRESHALEVKNREESTKQVKMFIEGAGYFLKWALITAGIGFGIALLAK